MITPRKTPYITDDGLSVYTLGPQRAVAGPFGHDPKSIDPDNLPPGFRWVDEAELFKLHDGYADHLSSRNE